MRRNKTFLAAGVLLLMITLAGCGAKKPQKATLTLESNPTTGYQWIVEQDPEIFDISSEYIEDAAEGATEPMVGVGGTETFTLTPKKEGRTKINFLYKQLRIKVCPSNFVFPLHYLKQEAYSIITAWTKNNFFTH